MHAVEQQLAALAADMADATLLQTVPGVGLITATALVALVTDIRRFRSGRQFAEKVVSQPFASWNRIAGWLRQLEAIRAAP